MLLRGSRDDDQIRTDVKAMTGALHEDGYSLEVIKEAFTAYRRDPNASGFWPSFPDILPHLLEAKRLRGFQAAQDGVPALPAPGASQGTVREEWFDRCERLGQSRQTLMAADYWGWRPIWERHMQDRLADDELVAALQRVFRGESAFPTRQTSQVGVRLVQELGEQLQAGGTVVPLRGKGAA